MIDLLVQGLQFIDTGTVIYWYRDCNLLAQGLQFPYTLFAVLLGACW